MKVKIGPFTRWIGPYQIAEFLCFWAKPEVDEFGLPCKPDYVHKFGEWLAHGSIRPERKTGDVYSLFDEDRHVTFLYKICNWIESKKKRTIKVHIDKYDTWSMDHTLGYIILPMLKQLQETKHGGPWVDDEDVPEELRSTSAPPKENDYDIDDNHFKRWDWVLDEMIFAFETKSGSLQDWEDQFHTGKRVMNFVKMENGNSRMVRGEDDTSHFDLEGQKEYQKRITNGFRLFGKYYEGLWD